MKTLSFRFDIDTHKCIRDGVPKLLALAQEHNIYFTFFLNPGVAVHRRSTFVDRLRRTQVSEKISILSPMKKLGVKDYIYIVLKNPSIVRKYKREIKQLVDSGHEIGLHGGRNHELWQRYAHLWNEEVIQSEIKWGVNELRVVDKNISLVGFASPSWNSPPALEKILGKNKFIYVADIHTDKPVQDISKKGNIVSLPTNIAGEPGGVGYFEHCRAKDMNDDEIINDFQQKLKLRKKIAVVYDHPYFVGVQEISLLRKIIRMSLAEGYIIKPMKDLL